MEMISWIGSAFGPLFLLILGISQIMVGERKIRRFAQIDMLEHFDGKCRFWSGIVLGLCGIALGVGVYAYKLHS